MNAIYNSNALQNKLYSFSSPLRKNLVYVFNKIYTLRERND